MRRDSRKTTSIARASFFNCAASASAFADGFTVASDTTELSAFETIFCATTSTSPFSNRNPAFFAATVIRSAKFSPFPISGSPGMANNRNSGTFRPPARNCLFFRKALFMGVAEKILRDPQRSFTRETPPAPKKGGFTFHAPASSHQKNGTRLQQRERQGPVSKKRGGPLHVSRTPARQN